MKTTSLLQKLFLVLLLCMLSACVSTESLPTSWGELENHEQDNDCSYIEGIYKNKGENPKGDEVSRLLQILIEHPDQTEYKPEELQDYYKAQNAEIVELRFKSDTLLIIRGNNKEFEKEWVLDASKNHFTCKNGYLKINRNRGFHVAVVAAHKWNFLTLYKSKTHLVVSDSDATVGVVVFMPVVGFGNQWRGFPIIPGENSATRKNEESKAMY